MDTFDFHNNAEEKKPESLFYTPITIIIDLIWYIYKSWFYFVSPICQLVIGVVFIHQCPIQRFIPIYLLVSSAGSFIFLGINIFLKLVNYIALARNTVQLVKCCISTNCAINCCAFSIKIPYRLFSFIWFIAGNVWVYQVQSRVQYDHSNITETYCQETLYKFSYISIIINWVLTFILYSCDCCLRNPSLQYFCCPMLVDQELIAESSFDLHTFPPVVSMLQTSAEPLRFPAIEQTTPHSSRPVSEIDNPLQEMSVVSLPVMTERF
ncbi:unnamed protein product [Adineta ricciae]|uniref:Uncharacterized protein n=1 Tax=Adineta ricciae TaxID=249248 RepID=A0A815E1X4_ADIRI|nr:unnamed protein product [Adineta ricciae]